MWDSLLRLTSILVISFAALAALACTSTSDHYFDGVDVYVGGFDGDTPLLWHNDRLAMQPMGILHGLIHAMDADSNGLYIVGMTGGRNGFYASERVRYFTPDTTYATGVAVDGGRAYIGGGTGTARGLAWNRACYWVIDTSLTAGDDDGDGVLDISSIPVEPIVLDGEFALAFDIAVSGDVVVLGGFTTNYLDPTTHIASVWIDGELTLLTDGARSAEVMAVAISGSDVFAAGREIAEDGTSTAVAWKNEERVALDLDPSTSSSGNAILIDGEEVYFAGFEGANACYWKNGQRVELSSGGIQGMATSITLIDGNVWVGGTIVLPGNEIYGQKNRPCVWKNGNRKMLTIDGQAPDGDFSVTAMHVTPR